MFAESDFDLNDEDLGPTSEEDRNALDEDNDNDGDDADDDSTGG